MAFSQPGAGGDTFNAADHNGHLLIVYPKRYEDEVQTKNGASSAADVDIVIVDKYDATGKPVSFINARLFGNLARSVRNDIGGQVLGRLGQGPNTRGTPPWILANFTDQDVALADPIDTAYRQGHFAPATNPMQANGAPPASAPTPAPQQQWQTQAPPVASPPTSTAPQWQAPPAQAAPAPTPAAAPAPQWSPGPATAPAPTQQWSPPPVASAPAPATPAATPPVSIDPGLLAFLASRGINGPFPDQATAEAIAATLPQ